MGGHDNFFLLASWCTYPKTAFVLGTTLKKFDVLVLCFLSCQSVEDLTNLKGDIEIIIMLKKFWTKLVERTILLSFKYSFKST